MDKISSTRSPVKRLILLRQLRCEIGYRVYAGLAALARKLAADFMAINRVHNDHIIGAVVAQECRFYDFLPGARQKFADAVRVNVDYVLYLIVHIERRQKCDGLRPGTPENRALPGGGPFAECRQGPERHACRSTAN